MSSPPVDLSSESRSVPASPSSELMYTEGHVDMPVFSPTGHIRIRTVTYPLMTGEEGKALDFPSNLTISAVRTAADKYNLDPSALCIVPRPCDRACSPPVGYFTMFVDSLKYGLRVPLHNAVRDLLLRFDIPVGRITPNSVRHLISLGAEAARLGVPFTVELFNRFFTFKLLPTKFLYISPRPGAGFKAKCPSKVPGWQEKFFFCQAENVPSIEWSTAGVPDPGYESDDLGNVLAELGQVSGDYTEAELIAAGLSPYRPEVDVSPGEDISVFLYDAAYR